MTFKDNWNFSEQHINNVKAILKENAFHIVSVEVATPDEDMKQSTDLKVVVTSGDIAVRIRRPYYDFRDITIRAYNKGRKTEIHKLRDGCADWYLYAWTNDEGGFADWVLLDINKMRDAGLFHENRNIQMNKDKTTGFVAYGLPEIYAVGGVVVYDGKGVSSKIQPPLFV